MSAIVENKDDSGKSNPSHGQVEAALRESEARSRTIIQTAMDGFFLANEKSRLLDVNDRYCQMSGYSRTELLRMGIPDIEAAESPADVQAHIQQLMSVGEHRFETRHRRKDGTIFDV